MVTLPLPHDARWIKADFEEWSGGFPPESDQQITAYVDNTLPADVDETAARRFLLAWMNDPDSDQ